MFFSSQVQPPPDFQIPLNPVYFSPERLDAMDRLVPSDLSAKDRPRKVMSTIYSFLHGTIAFK